MADLVAELRPAQLATLEAIGDKDHAQRPEFDPALRTDLLSELEAGMEPVIRAMDAASIESLRLTKHLVGAAHGCQVRFLHEDAAGFPGWSVPTARGSVAHKAIELSVHVPDAVALDLVDEAITCLAEGDRSLADWLGGLGDTERAELRAEANDRVAKFLECWPPLRPQWHPVTESRTRLDLHGGRISLNGKVDLTLGRASGTTAGKVLVDFKTGGFAPVHVEDLRLYALVETTRVGVPPRRLASCYLDSGRFMCEDVTEAVLFSAVARLVDAARLIVGLRSGETAPILRTGPACRWCPLLSECASGREFLDERDG